MRAFTKTIHVRRTRLGERFNENDQFLAWVDGSAAGTMAKTPSQTVKKLLEYTPDFDTRDWPPPPTPPQEIGNPS